MSREDARSGRWSVRRVLADPLTHFLAAGLALFAVYSAVTPDGGGGDDSRIVVDRPALLEFIQYRTKTFDAAHAEATLDAMGPDQLARTVRDYVREEALYREAKSLGLGSSDYVIKRRMIQTLEFVTGNATAPSPNVSDDALQGYYQAHRQAYMVQPQLTMTHVFFSADRGGLETARQRAKAALETLNRQHVGFDDASRYGDHFLYNVNYVEDTPEALAAHFGSPFAQAVFAMKAEPGQWQGPVESAYGVHLVMITKKETEHLQPLAEIRAQVRQDYLADEARERQRKLEDQMVAQYKVDLRVRPKVFDQASSQ
ncbi:MAG: hypothetical protein GC201_02285 [Alphaproteobacteria bacterium]|nr:hypothetical protein [Alphaproteobacteria bacterium]